MMLKQYMLIIFLLSCYNPTIAISSSLQNNNNQSSNAVNTNNTVSIRTVLVEQGSKIPVNIAKGVTTSIYFTEAYDPDLVVGGDNSFDIKLLPKQISLSAEHSKIGNKTNLNVVTNKGQVIVFLINVTDSKNADPFIKIVFNKEQLNNSNETHQNNTTSNCEEIKILQDLGNEFTYRHIDKREIDVLGEGVILKIHDFIKIGPQAYVRFSVHNRSRYIWTPGQIKIFIYSNSVINEIKEDNIAVHFNKTTLSKGEEVFGAFTFALAEVSSKTNFSFQAIEKNGSRHPKVDGVKL